MTPIITTITIIGTAAVILFLLFAVAVSGFVTLIFLSEWEKDRAIKKRGRK